METGGRRLLPKKAISDTDYDTALANYEAAKANVAAGKATIRQNKASVNTARTNLGYCTIKSPVRGVIIDRRVNIGQTVVASLNAPSLFLIAKDLRRMQVWASVNEADIGHIQLDMPVRFTVDAYPAREVSRQGDANPHERHDDAERRHVHGHRDDRQFQRQVAALSDGERPVRDGQAVGRAAGAQCGVALEAAGVEQIDPTVSKTSMLR